MIIPCRPRSYLTVTLFLVICFELSTICSAVDFGSSTAYPLGNSTSMVPVGVVLGDFNGDGRIDIAVLLTGSGTDVSILLGNGDGTFSSAVDTYTGAGYSYTPSSIVAGDFNGDHKLDLCILFWDYSSVTNSTSSRIITLLGNGDGTFQAPKSFILPGVGSIGGFADYLAVADFNLDNKADLAVSIGPTVRVFLGNGNGTFESSNPLTVSSDGGQRLAAADFNRDGESDLAIVRGAGIGAAFNVFLGRGDGTFQSPLTTELGTSPNAGIFGLRVADLNHDGAPDLLVNAVSEGCYTPFCGISQGERLSSFLGKRDGTFQPEAILAEAFYWHDGYWGNAEGGDFISAAILGNLNGDGEVDLMYQRSTFSDTGWVPSDEVLLGKPDGSFSPISAVNLTSLPSAIGDFNGDGLGDLVSFDNTAVYVFLNTSPVPEFTLSPSATDLSVNRGGTATATLAIVWPSAFSGYVDLTCSVTPSPASAPTCALKPITVAPGDSGTATSQLTVATTGPAASLVSPMFRHDLPVAYALWLPFSGLTVLGTWVATGRSKRKKMIFGVLFIGLFLAASWTACGGGRNPGSSGPP